jgi:hypothetical protein
MNKREQVKERKRRRNQMAAKLGDPAVNNELRKDLWLYYFVCVTLANKLDAPRAEWDDLITRLAKVHPGLTPEEGQQYTEIMQMVCDVAAEGAGRA